MYIVFGPVAQENKPVIGVLGLENGGGIGEAAIDTLCNRISTQVENSSKYLVLQREFIPMVLQEQGFTVIDGICSSFEGLAAAGLLLSADEMIGGSIIKDSDGITLELLRIRVSDRAQLAKQTITTLLSRQDFLNLELPELVNTLIKESQLAAQEKNHTSGEALAKNRKSGISDSNAREKSKRKRRAIGFITTSVLTGAAAAAGAIYYFGDRTSATSDEVPLGNLPNRNP